MVIISRAIKLLSTFQARLITLYTLLFAVAFAFITVAVNRMVGSFLIEQRCNSQLEQVENISTQAAGSVESSDAKAMYAIAVTAGRELGGRVLILDWDGVVIADSFSTLNGRVLRHNEIEEIISGQANAAYGFYSVDSGDTGFLAESKKWAVYYTASVVYQSRNLGIIVASVPIDDLVSLIQSTTLRFAFVSIGILILSAAASILISRMVTKPINHMTAVIRDMSHGRFDQRMEAAGTTELKEMAQTFNMMSERLQNLDKLRNEFVANASHELKTPLSTIKILSESLLYQNASPETYREFLIDINTQVNRMGSLINDLLVQTKLDEPETMLNYTSESLDDIIGEAISALSALAGEKKIELLAPESGIILECDRMKLGAAITNLLINGIKYTPPEGSVKVEAVLQDGVVRISVIDTGIGIPKEDLPHVFERFYRVDKARSRDTGGTGLGLSIVQQICRMHGGEVYVRSKENIGSIFIIEIPQRRQAQ